MHCSPNRIILALFICSPVICQAGDAGEWRYYGGDPGGMRFSPLTQIDTSNVARLRRVWSYHTGEVQPGLRGNSTNRIQAFEATPLAIDGVLYFTTPSSRMIALDAETGSELWQYDPQASASKRRSDPNRGLAYWEGPSPGGKSLEKRLLYGTATAQLIELDARTGKMNPGFGKEGVVDLREGFADQWPKSAYAMTSPTAT